jgi:hypothetical protein
MRYRAQPSLRKDISSALLCFGVTCMILAAVSAAAKDGTNTGEHFGSSFSLAPPRSSITHHPAVTPKAPTISALQTAQKPDNLLKGQNDVGHAVRAWTKEL